MMALGRGADGQPRHWDQLWMRQLTLSLCPFRQVKDAPIFGLVYQYGLLEAQFDERTYHFQRCKLGSPISSLGRKLCQALSPAGFRPPFRARLLEVSFYRLPPLPSAVIGQTE